MNPHPRLARLGARDLVRVAGPDWRTLLQGLLTQDVETLAPGELRYAALLTPQGRLANELFVLGTDDGVLLDVPAAQREGLISRLSLYRLRAKVEIGPAEGDIFAAWDSDVPPALGDERVVWARDPRLPELGWRGYGAGGETELDDEAYDAHRLATGVPDPLRDCPDDKTYPIEADFDLLGGIDFKKGCFVGQETTSRMKRRGAVKARMVPISFDGPPPRFGAELLAGELRAGAVRSGREGRAIALVRLDRAQGATLTVDGRPARLDAPDWLSPALAAGEVAGAPP